MKLRAIHILKVLLIFCTALLSTAKLGSAQDSNVQFEHLQIPGGQASSYVTSVVQDSLGFIWIGTWNGLYRYDGYTFTGFTQNPADSGSISANWIETLYIDSNGTLWAGTYGGGLNRFNDENEAFASYQNEAGNPLSLSQDSVTVILEDHLGDLWIGTMNGLNRMNRETGTFEQFNYDPGDPTSLNNNQVRALYEDQQGTLWVGLRSHSQEEDVISLGPGGLSRFNRETRTFTNYVHNPNDSTSLIDNHVRTIFEDSHGTFWVGTSNDGLHIMDRTSGTFTRLRTDFENPDKLSRPFSNYSSFEGTGPITFIMEDQSGTIWMGAVGNLGINRYDPESGLLTRYDPMHWGNTLPWSMLQSNDGTLWLATIGNGIWILRSGMNPFTDIVLENLNWGSILRYDNSGALWTGAASNSNFYHWLTAFNVQDGDSEIINSIELEISGTLSAFDQTSDGTLWLGAYRGSPASQAGDLFSRPSSFDEFVNAFTAEETQFGPVLSILEDSDGSIWIGTKWTGLFSLDPLNGSLIQYSYDPDSTGSLSHSNVTTLYQSSSESNIIWIGTEGGLNRLNRDTDTITNYLNNPGNINITSIEEDSNGTLWVATLGDGLFSYNRELDSFIQFTPLNSGLPDSHILCLLGDTYGTLWMSSGDKITRFDPAERSFFTFSGENSPDAGTFSSKACDKSVEGEFAFGGISGFTTFYPAQMPLYENPPKIVFTSFVSSNHIDSEEQLQKSITLAESITLLNSQNTFSIEFAALNYTDSESNQYMYQLVGYDEYWVDSGTQRRASYRRIPHGEYDFKVKASNNTGVWSREVAAITINVLPPWWQTWWAYGLYALIFSAGVFAVDRFQRRRLIKREQEKARERELKQAKEIEKAYHNLEIAHENLKAAQDQLVQQEKLASLGQLTAGIAHEIKNPLNFVNNFSDVSIELVEEAREELLSEKAKASPEQSRRGKRHKSPFEGGKDGVAGQGDDTESSVAQNLTLALEILDDIESNLRKIHEHGSRADGIVKSMLQHSRGGDGKPDPTLLNPLIKEYVNLAYHGMRAGDDPIGVDIELDLDESIGDVNLVAEDFSRVILNLCNNSFDAMREKAQLTADSPQLSAEPGNDYEPRLIVRTRSKQQAVTIEFKDNGIGIPAEIKDKILQPFFTTKKGTAGTGLGLSITNDIIKAHGGSLDIESEPGKTVFTITLSR